MSQQAEIENFLLSYNETTSALALEVRKLLLKLLPDVIEQLDGPARMVAYCYGQRYVDMVCMLIPSKKGLKIGFYKGTELPDPARLLEGTGKVSRYVEIHSSVDVRSKDLKDLVQAAHKACEVRRK